MGWDGTYPKHFKNGKVDRIAELTDRWTWENDSQAVSVEKLIMKGTTCYGAIRIKDKSDSHNDDKIIGVVALTRIDKGYFMVKTMEETVGPYCYDCPESILKLLTETENEWALEWRRKCREYNKLPKLGSLKEGTEINFICPYDTTYHNKGDEVTLVREKNYAHRLKWHEKGKAITWPPSLIPKTFRIVN